MVKKELGNTAKCIKKHAGNDLDTSNMNEISQVAELGQGLVRNEHMDFGEGKIHFHAAFSISF